MKNNNIYKIDIFKYMLALYEVTNYIEKDLSSLSSINQKIEKFVIQFDSLFPKEEFLLSESKIQRLLNCVGNAIFEKKQKLYFAKFSDIMGIFIASSLVEVKTDKKVLFEFIKKNLVENIHNDDLSLSTFYNLCNNKSQIYKGEANKIKYYMKRKISKTLKYNK